MSTTARVLWYIEGHLSGDLSLEEIAGVAGISRFHLSRMFPATTGHSLSGYIRARRLSEAAKRLADGAPDILTVALSAGYGSHEAFTRAFRQHFQVTPEQVRAEGRNTNLKLLEAIRMDEAVERKLAAPRIEHRPAFHVFGLSQRSDSTNAGIAELWDRFAPHLGNIAGQRGTASYGVMHNHDDAGCYDYVCGVEVAEYPSEPAGFARVTVPEQNYVVFEHDGHISAIGSTWKNIWDEAMAASGHQGAKGPLFERYDERFDGQTGLGVVEIWIPIED